jgi:hypothetical protein
VTGLADSGIACVPGAAGPLQAVTDTITRTRAIERRLIVPPYGNPQRDHGFTAGYGFVPSAVEPESSFSTFVAIIPPLKLARIGQKTVLDWNKKTASMAVCAMSDDWVAYDK